MTNEILELQPLQAPGEILKADSSSRYEKYKSDGVYEYTLLPNGKPNKSRVKITYNYGDVYDGSLKAGKQTGIGKYFWKDGGQYEGSFKKGKLDGKGQYTALNGDVYEGNFKNSLYDGEGKYTWADGSSFQGTFKNGQLLNGRFTDVNGNVYACKFTYKHNGERKNSDIRLVKFGASAQAQSANHETNKPTTASTAAKKPKENKNGLQSKDVTLMAAIRKSARGADFKNLYSGAAGKSEKSEKNLITILNFFCNSDAEQIKRIFKSSSIYDPTKGQEHLTNMINGVIKGNRDYTAAAKAGASKNKGNTRGKVAAKGAAR